MNTEIICITDRSGSMHRLQKDVIGGFNKFLHEQAAIPGAAKITYAQFDDEYDVLYEGATLESAPRLTTETYIPRGSTSLLDAIGRTLNEQGKRIAGEKWADKVIVCIITDGQENSSKEFTREKIKAMITHAQQHEWYFVFLAANQDAFAEATSYGMDVRTVSSFAASAVGITTAYETINVMTRNLREGNENGND